MKGLKDLKIRCLIFKSSFLSISSYLLSVRNLNSKNCNNNTSRTNSYIRILQEMQKYSSHQNTEKNPTKLATNCSFSLPQVLIWSTRNFLSKFFHRFFFFLMKKFPNRSHFGVKRISKTLLLRHRLCLKVLDLTSLGFWVSAFKKISRVIILYTHNCLCQINYNFNYYFIKRLNC